MLTRAGPLTAGIWGRRQRDAGYYYSRRDAVGGGVVLVHSALYENSGREIVSLEKLKMFDILAPCLVMREHLPANL